MDIIFSHDAGKQYQRLSKPEQTKIHKKLTALKYYPYEGKKLTGELAGVRSLRAWPYRILYEVNENKKRVEIHKIAHRQGVYK